MATIANARTPYTQAAPDHVGALVINRFPTPPIAWGFMTTVEGFDLVESTIEFPWLIASAFQHEGVYSEPSTGQIWPR